MAADRPARRTVPALPADLPPPPPAAAWAERLSDLLLEHLATAARGPRREGLFALWLVTRAAGDAVVAFGTGDRIWRRRHEALAQRLSSLTLPAPLRRALQSALVTLEQPAPAQGALSLALLVAPVRDVLGDPIAAIMDAAAREARAALARPA